MKILCVEDEKELAKHITKALVAAGHVVECCSDGPAAVATTLRSKIDLMVLDINLPGFDGFEVLRRLREKDAMPRVIMLTARGELHDRVAGLKAGADDYLPKPFAMEELLARIEAVGRRSSMAAPAAQLIVGDLRMDPLRRRLFRGEEEVSVSPREFEVLQILMQEPGRVFSRDEICEIIWQREHEYDTRTIEVFVMRLRKKLDEGRKRPMIETVRGVGYRIQQP